MFTKNPTYIKSNKVSPELFINNNDYNNSELLYKLDQYSNWSEYKVTKYERRIDLISQDIYADKSYYWLLLYINKINNNDIIRGTILKYIPLKELNNLMVNI